MCKDHDYCHLKIAMKHNNILKYNHNQDKKSMKIPSVIYVDTESLLEKKCDNDLNKNNKNKQIYAVWLFYIYTLLIW